MHSPYGAALDPSLRSTDAIEFEQGLREHFIGQEEAVTTATRMVETYMAGMHDRDKTAGVMLMLGPTGTGKTRSLALRPNTNLAHAREAQPEP